MTDIRVKLLSVFRVESREHLDFIRGAMIPLAAGDEERGALAIDEVFRRAHSLKGAARATGLKPIEAIAHRLETLFARVRSGERRIDPASAALVLTVADAIEDWLAAYDGDKEPPAPAAAIRLLDEALGETAPAVAPAEPAKVSEPAPAPVPEAPADDGTLRVHATDLDGMLRSAERLQAEAQRYHLLAPPLRAIEDGMADLEREWKKLMDDMSAMRSRFGEAALPIGVSRRVDALTRGLREVSTEARGIRLRHRRTAWTLGRICNDLHDGIRRVRMVPAGDVFGAFRRMMRDLARDVGKEISFHVRGADVEADRVVLQALKDPVMHLLRNAAFHGIEPAATRKDKGKPAAGKVMLSFERRGGQLAVKVEDDGAGIDGMKVSEKAVRAGLLTPAAAAAAGEDVINLIFQPGFSTADEVGEIAGRGMGLSVAYEAVRRLNGALEVLPRDGGGTVFYLTLPLSVSAQRLVMVTARGAIYGIPAGAVARLVRVKESELVSIEGAPAIAFEGRHVHLRSLVGLLGFIDQGVSSHSGELDVVIVRWGEGLVGIAVDGFATMRDAVIKDLGFALPEHSKVGGAILLENGNVALVLNPYELVRDFVVRAAAAPLITELATKAPSVPVILIVDDSMTTRTLEKSILEAHGYRVKVAVDGLDALLQLRANPVDLVVADVEMPRIDGFSLLKELKRDPALSHIPVILVTSLQRREDLERGYSLGAEAYLPKQKFDQGELLDTIRQIL
ncbi:MAG: response regulator [Rhodospirillales bacterium]|nr:response regulator [Rhodospirillales bacterium]